MATVGVFISHMLHAAMLLLAAPLVAGLTRFVRARLDGRRGASPLQPYRDLVRALRRRPVLATSASPVSEGAPVVAVAALALAAALLPPVALAGLLPATPLAPVSTAPVGGIAAAPSALSGDLVLIAALLGLSRFASALALLDAGTAAGGLGAAQLVARPVLFEPVLLLVALCAATIAGAEASAGSPSGMRAPLLLAIAALLLVAAAETPRPPIAAEDTMPHDLTIAPETAGLELSGWHLAFCDYARALRATVFLALVAALLPGPAAMTGAAGAVLQPLLGLAELAGICVLLAVVESGLAALHSERVASVGIGATVLAAVAAALLLLGGVAA